MYVLCNFNTTCQKQKDLYSKRHKIKRFTDTMTTTVKTTLKMLDFLMWDQPNPTK